jgi:hypothetical protein
LLLGHQRLVAQGQPGFVDREGRPTIPDARTRFEHFRRAGEKELEVRSQMGIPDS